MEREEEKKGRGKVLWGKARFGTMCPCASVQQESLAAFAAAPRSTFCLQPVC